MINIEEVFPGLVLVSSKSQFLIKSAFMRAQALYDSPYLPEWDESYLTHQDIIDSTLHRESRFDYYQNSLGFNIPGTVLDLVWNLPGITEEEGILLEALNSKYSEFRDIYLIGCYDKSDSLVLNHEIAHGLYYLSDEYRFKCRELIYNHPDPSNMILKLSDFLLSSGCSYTSLVDELQAYLSTSSDQFFIQEMGLMNSEIDLDLLNSFKTLFECEFSYMKTSPYVSQGVSVL